MSPPAARCAAAGAKMSRPANVGPGRTAGGRGSGARRPRSGRPELRGPGRAARCLVPRNVTPPSLARAARARLPVPTPGSTTATTTPAQGRAPRAEGQTACPHVLRPHLVGEVDYRHVRQPRPEDTVEHADGTVRQPEVAQEADHQSPWALLHRGNYRVGRLPGWLRDLINPPRCTGPQGSGPRPLRVSGTTGRPVLPAVALIAPGGRPSCWKPGAVPPLQPP